MRAMVWTDAQMLDVLDLIDEFGWPASRVAERYGVSRNSIIGLRHRILSDLKESERAPGPEAAQPENCDGGMVQGWWRAGLKAQDAKQKRKAA